MVDIKQAYTDILQVCEKYKDIEWYEFADIERMAESCKEHLEVIRWKEEHGIILKHNSRILNMNYIEVTDNICLSYFNNAKEEKEKWYWRYISWSDDDTQPNNEWLMNISFPTGAYIFWDHYPKNIFEELFEELNSYWPKFIDTANKCLYFSLDKAWKIQSEYKTILKKYEELSRQEFVRIKKEKLQKELDSLK